MPFNLDAQLTTASAAAGGRGRSGPLAPRGDAIALRKIIDMGLQIRDAAEPDSPSVRTADYVVPTPRSSRRRVRRSCTTTVAEWCVGRSISLTALWRSMCKRQAFPSCPSTTDCLRDTVAPVRHVGEGRDPGRHGVDCS